MRSVDAQRWLPLLIFIKMNGGAETHSLSSLSRIKYICVCVRDPFVSPRERGGDEGREALSLGIVSECLCVWDVF